MPIGIYKRNPEQGYKHSIMMKGRKLSSEHKSKIKTALKGKKKTIEHNRNVSKALTGKKFNVTHIESLKKAHTGVKLSDYHRKKISEGHKGEKSHLWEGGLTEKHHQIINSFEYKEWRKQVFARDNYMCIKCGATKCWLEADHIKPKSIYPELIFDVDNGQTLCKICHKIKTKIDMLEIRVYRINAKKS